jgi:hypothetical protein
LNIEVDANGSTPQVPDRPTESLNGHAGSAGQGLLGLLISFLVAERSGFQLGDTSGMAGLQEFAARMTREAMQSMEHAAMAAPPATPAAPSGASTGLMPTQK